MPVVAQQSYLPVAATAGSWIPLNIFANPCNFTCVAQKIGGGEVSANAIFTIDNIYDSTVTPVGFRLAGLDITVNYEDTTAVATAYNFPARGVQFRVAAVSGSASFIFSLLQTGA